MTPRDHSAKTHLVEVTRQGSAVLLTLHDPDRGNALGDQMIDALNVALDELGHATDETVVFQGAGKGFCGGLDLTNLDAESDGSLMARLIRIELTLQRIAALPFRTAAFAHSFAFGAGADLLLACDLAIATPDCKLSFPGRRFGLVLGTGRLAERVGSARALEAVLSTSVLRAGDLPRDFVIPCDQDAWPARLADLAAPLGCDRATRGLLLTRARGDRITDGNADLAALVRSLAPKGLVSRVKAYAQEVRSARRR